jgi:hypothetical protein
MPVRSFKVYTCTTAVQPLLGTTLQTAAIASQTGANTLLVGDTSMFVGSDSVNIVPASGSTAPWESTQVTVLSATTMTATLRNNHNAGDFVVLSWPCSNVQVMPVGAHTPTSSVWIGTGATPTVTTAGTNAFWDLFYNGAYNPQMAIYDSDNTSNYWVISASGMAYYLPSSKQG